jgi:glycosyltransferase involved in cell wall biosynthesis
VPKLSGRIKTSIVIPCYNEEENIEKILAGFDAVLRKDAFGIEIIFVDNGSTDRTRDLLQKKIPEHKFAKAVRVPQNLGYGHGIMEGLKKANGSLVGYMHGDMQVLPEAVVEIARSLSSTQTGEPLFFKAHRYGRNFYEDFFTAGMSLFCSLLFKTRLTDINAQPTFFSKDFLQSLTDTPSDFSLDLFLFVTAKKRRAAIFRTPVRVHKRMSGISSWNAGIASRFKLSFFFMKAALRIKKNFQVVKRK